MWKLLITLNKNLFIAIPVMLLFGFACGVLFEPASLKHAIVPLTFLMVYPMMVTLKLRKVFQSGDGKAQWLAQAINFGIIPFAVLFIGRLFFPDEPYLALGLLLAGLVPTSGMTISWTGFAKGNVEAAVKMTVIGLVLGSLATPVYVKLLMGADIDMDLTLVVRQILLIVFLPMGAGHLTQSLLLRRYGQEAFQKRMAPRFPALSALGVLGIVFVAMALKAGSIYQSPELLLSIFIPIMIIYALNFALSTWVGRRLAAPRGCHRPGVRDRDAQPVHCARPCDQRLRNSRGQRGPGDRHGVRGPGAVGRLVCQIHGSNLRPHRAGRSPGHGRARGGSGFPRVCEGVTAA